MFHFYELLFSFYNLIPFNGPPNYDVTTPRPVYFWELACGSNEKKNVENGCNFTKRSTYINPIIPARIIYRPVATDADEMIGFQTFRASVAFGIPRRSLITNRVCALSTVIVGDANRARTMAENRRRERTFREPFESTVYVRVAPRLGTSGRVFGL